MTIEFMLKFGVIRKVKYMQKEEKLDMHRYLQTLEFGEQKNKRKSDKIRFDYFVVADSLNYNIPIVEKERERIYLYFSLG